MPKLRAHSPLTKTALLVLFALSSAAADAHAQEAKPAPQAQAAAQTQPVASAPSAAQPSPAQPAPTEQKAERAPETKAETISQADADGGEAAAASAAPSEAATEAAPEAGRRRAASAEAGFFTAPAGGAPGSASDAKRAPLFARTLTAGAAGVLGQSGDAGVSAPDAARRQPSAQSSASVYTPLTSDEKMKRAFKNAFLNPGGYARVAFSSIWTQWNEDSQPHKTTEDEVADGASRFAINFGRRATRSILGGGVFPVLFRQDPRYERAEEGKGFASRAGWAVSRVFVTRGDSGRHQPNVSNWAGSLSSSAISNLWERSTPGHDRIGTDATFKRFARSFLNDSINNLFREFWPDIKGIFGM